MNNKQKLRLQYIKNILINILDSKELSNDLIFKWGTSLMFFYNLDRFSEDLDFNYTKDVTISIIKSKFRELWYDFLSKKTNFWVKFSIKYWEWDNNFHCIVDLSKYSYNIKPKTDLKIFWWKPIKVLTLEQNFAHKLCAFYERKKWRDVVDVNFYLSKWIFPDEGVLIERHKKIFEEFLYLFIKELQAPYLCKRISKVLDQLHYSNFTIGEYKKDIIGNISKNYTNNVFNINLDYKDDINKWWKIIYLNNEMSLLIDWRSINDKIMSKYVILSTEDFEIVYSCESLEKLYSYINNVLIRESLKIQKNQKIQNLLELS